MDLKQLTARQASNADYEMICRILNEHQLPAEDCLAHLSHFFILEFGNRTAGIGGLEVYGQYGLLRSIVILDDFRLRGIGRHLVHLIIEYARDQGIRSIYLLTEDSQQYFSRLGFLAVDRTSAPDVITQTQQFKSLCPASAVLMSMEIDTS